ncbi:hypothetical protein RFI_07020 [Reticulomyxa filosa]|uniref:Uncharacterized protein n=1 Tax=Reticulomyxa filosa TaxID=46433 RepID=X6NW99_RETFI|nr:hypothetical protein RFI_07020 [Reticulomyxa filosa]|eukprot:ETO30104.1 hypothetical protein RFI_07020 [Reticulomyxa filosa]
MKKQTSNEPMVIELNPWVDADTQHCTLYCCRSFSPHEHSTSMFNQVYVGKFQTSTIPDLSSSVQTVQQSKINDTHRFFVQVERCEIDQSCHVDSKTNMNVCVLMNTSTTTVQQLIDHVKKVKQLTHCKHLTQMYFVEHLQQLSKYVYIPVPNDVMLHTVLTHYLWDNSKPTDLAAKPDRWVLGKTPNSLVHIFFYTCDIVCSLEYSFFDGLFVYASFIKKNFFSKEFSFFLFFLD